MSLAIGLKFRVFNRDNTRFSHAATHYSFALAPLTFVTDLVIANGNRADGFSDRLRSDLGRAAPTVLSREHERLAKVATLITLFPH